MNGETKKCGCREVVTRVYRELRDREIPDGWAFDTATRIYRLHHPEANPANARETIAAWVGTGIAR